MRSWFVVRQCSWCRRVELGRSWIRVPGLPLLQWRLQLPWIRVYSARHGICPDCSAQLLKRPRYSRLRPLVDALIATAGRESPCD